VVERIQAAIATKITYSFVWLRHRVLVVGRPQAEITTASPIATVVHGVVSKEAVRVQMMRSVNVQAIA